MAKQQDTDPDLRALKLYILQGDLPADQKKAKEFVLGRSMFKVVDDVLYHVEGDKTLPSEL